MRDVSSPSKVAEEAPLRFPSAKTRRLARLLGFGVCAPQRRLLVLRLGLRGDAAGSGFSARRSARAGAAGASGGRGEELFNARQEPRIRLVLSCR